MNRIVTDEDVFGPTMYRDKDGTRFKTALTTWFSDPPPRNDDGTLDEWQLARKKFVEENPDRFNELIAKFKHTEKFDGFVLNPPLHGGTLGVVEVFEGRMKVEEVDFDTGEYREVEQ